MKKIVTDEARVGSDDEEESDRPILESLYMLKDLRPHFETKFFSPELRKVFSKFADYVTTAWNTERGRKSTFTSIDVFDGALGVDARMCIRCFG